MEPIPRGVRCGRFGERLNPTDIRGVGGDLRLNLPQGIKDNTHV